MDKKENGARSAGSAVKLDMSFGHEGGSDFSLPDYLPEVQRLLAVYAVVLPETKFLSGNVLEIGGTLSYDVVYSDVDGKLATASLVSDYSADTALPVQCDNIGELFVSTEAENSTCRVTSARTLNIKTRMRTRVSADEPVMTDGALAQRGGRRANEEEEASVERLTHPILSAVRGRGMTTGNVTGEISASPGDKVMMCSASLCVNDAISGDGAVSVSGEVFVSCIFDTNGTLCTKNARYPFESSVPVSVAEPSCEARAWGRAASVSVSPGEAGDGTFGVSVEYDIEAECVCKVDMSVCSDVYSTGYECEGEMRECEIVSPVLLGSSRVVLYSDSEGAFDGKGEVISVIPVSSSLQLATLPSGAQINGTVRVKVLLAGDEVAAHEMDVPLKYMLERELEGDFQSFINCFVLSASAKVVQGKISVTLEAYLSWSISEKKKVRYVSSVSLGDEKAPLSALSVRVYYPQSDEPIWSICKKYRADLARITRANPGLDELVPKGTPVIIY